MKGNSSWWTAKDQKDQSKVQADDGLVCAMWFTWSNSGGRTAVVQKLP